MSAQLLENIAYFDDDGLPLVGGKVYIGINGLEPVGNPQSIFADRDLTTSLTNPQTLGTDGIAANKIWISGKYSLRVESVLAVQHTLDLDLGSDEVSEFKELISVTGANSITASTSEVITSYTDKQIFVLNAAGTNTTTGVTLNVDTVGAKSIVKNFNQSLDPGDITANQSLVVIYNSTSDNFQWINASVKTKRQTKGSDIASASSITVPDNDGNVFDITGSVTIAAINGVKESFYTFQTDSTPTFTNSVSLIMIGGVDFTAAAGDVLEFYQLTSSTVINTNIAKADGNPVVTSSPLTTKGDIYAFDTDNNRLAVGTDEQVFIADSAETLGVKWGSLSISQGNLNTATGDLVGAGNATALFTAAGGEFGFWPTIRNPTGTANSAAGVTPCNTVNHLAAAVTVTLTSTLINRFLLSSGTGGITARQRYVAASPPYDLGDGDVYSFLFARFLKGTGAIISLSLSPDPVWANNGPTNIRPDFINKKGKKFKRAWRLKKGASLVDDDPFETQNIEITKSFKNSDMDLIPHPFLGNDLSKDVVCLIDPMSTIVKNMEIMKNSGDFPLDLFLNDYIRIDNEELKRGKPKGVTVYAAKMTDKKRV